MRRNAEKYLKFEADYYSKQEDGRILLRFLQLFFTACPGRENDA